jgi:hypothetical protein
MAAGSAAEVQSREAANVAGGLVHMRFFEGRQRIAIVVVDRRPPIVAGPN